MAQPGSPQGPPQQQAHFAGSAAGHGHAASARLPAVDNLERLTRVAARALRAPLAVLHLLHAGRKLGKTWIGLPESTASRLDALQPGAFLQHLHGASAPLLVRDAAREPAWGAPDSALQELGVAACMCVPLAGRQGEKLGSLCVMDTAARDWSDADLETLADIAATAAFEIGIRQDFAEQERREDALRESEARLRVAVRATGAAVWMIDLAHGGLEYFDRRGCEILQIDPEQREWPPGTLCEHLHPDDVVVMRGAFGASLSDRSGTVEYRVIRRDGEVRWMQGAGEPQCDAQGRLLRFIGVSFDITERKRAGQALRESEAQLRIITESTEAWLARIDLHQRYLFANRAFTERAGMRRRSVVGRTVREVAGERAYRLLAPELERALAGERVLFEKLVPYYAAGERYVRVEYIPELDAQGAVRSVVAVIVDLTQRRRAEEALRESEARLATLTATVPAMLFSTNADGRIDYVNDTFFEYSGLPREAARAPAWQGIVHPDDLPRVLASWEQSMRSGQDFNVECRLRRADGAYRWFKGYAAQLRDDQGGASKWLGVALDIDEQKKAEAALQDADRRKNEFLAVLAHELRNPLAPIRNSAHILQVLSVGEPRLKTTTDMISRQVSHMAHLIDDLLDVARITQGKITLRREPVELMPLLCNAVESMRPFIDARGHELRIEPPAGPVYLEADATRLTQVMSNLLSNATKYTDAGGRIWLSARLDGEQITIVVRDTGIGIGPEQMPHLFDPFTQSGSAVEHSQGGMGIGLALVKRLVEMHGGSVEASSAGPGKGAAFTVRLPAIRPERMPLALPPRHVQQEPPAAARLRVLVVDDNVDAEQSLSLLMRLQGHEVRAAHDGMEALRQARAFVPQIVVLDIGLPGLSGHDVARRLRRGPETSEAVLIAITGYGQAEDREQAIEAGFQHHMVKPVDPLALIQLIAAIGGQRAKTEAS
jgi:PAS domain S-box-containing protein